ncbi:uncharacterized protein LOC135465875 [Liolophura sinensis]|uniref:uncharacterized protein LOC135465875 n=1 Tax=Liolophura sinensis TaxID=3198878 RepID=UPI003159844C
MACMLQFYGKTGGGENGSLRAISNYQNPTLERLPRAGLAGFTDKTGDNGYPASRGVEELSPLDRNHDSASVSVHASRDVAASVVTGPLKIRESQPGEVSVRVHAVNSDSSSLQSPVKRFMSNPDLVERSSSRSRQEWKEQMRRKHLPAIFVNDAFEKEDSSNAVQNSSPPVSIDPQPVEKSHKKEGSNSSLYYFCGEYHPDNLTSSFSKPPTESESDGMSYQYDTVDISIVLDDTSSQTGAKITESKPFGSVSSGAKPPKKPVRKQQSMGKIGQNSAKTENSSIISDSSVVITPNIPMGRPVWPDDPETFEISEPFRDAKTFPSATSSQRSNSPSIHFDEEVDKGFEEALAIGYASVSALDSVPYFQSISEEPGGSLGLPDDNNPFSEDNLDDTRSEGSFVTQAVVSKHRHRHYSSESENPFDKVPINSSKPKTNIKNNHQSGNGDSGTGTWADYSNGFIDAEIREDDEAFTYKTRDPNSSSLPWPDDKVSNSHDRMSFDSDFSEDRFDEPTTQNGSHVKAPCNGYSEN